MVRHDGPPDGANKQGMYTPRKKKTSSGIGMVPVLGSNWRSRAPAAAMTSRYRCLRNQQAGSRYMLAHAQGAC
eukprot:354880-Chlamydomonas_euryale.AAC.6